MTEFEFQEPDFLDEDLRMVREQVRRFVDESASCPTPTPGRRRARSRASCSATSASSASSACATRSSTAAAAWARWPRWCSGEELARSSYGGVASALTVHSDMSIGHIAHRGTHEQKQKYLPAACAGEKIGAICVTEPDAGSDVAGLQDARRRARATAG